MQSRHRVQHGEYCGNCGRPNCVLYISGCCRITLIASGSAVIACDRRFDFFEASASCLSFMCSHVPKCTRFSSRFSYRLGSGAWEQGYEKMLKWEDDSTLLALVPGLPRLRAHFNWRRQTTRKISPPTCNKNTQVNGEGLQPKLAHCFPHIW